MGRISILERLAGLFFRKGRKMKRLSILLLVVLLANAVLAEEPVYFADPNLKAAVEEELGISDPNATDMLALTYLSANNKGIVYLTGLEYALNLTYLFLYNNQINDISPVSGLTNLTILYFSSNQISNISALSGLTNLTHLSLSYNQIISISHISGLTNLIHLYLYNNQIQHISAVSGLTNLTHLSLYDNQISDISAVSGLTNLLELYLDLNPLNSAAYCVYLPIIEDNNPSIHITYDSNPIPSACDCAGDCYVNFFDFTFVADYWLKTDCGDCGGADLDGNNDVDYDDIAILCDYWLDYYIDL